MDENTIQIIEVDEIEVVDVEIDSAFPALGMPNEQLNHALLNNKDIPDQHPITAIRGLRHELDDIKSLQVVYSDKKQQADYYLWHDENPVGENRQGLFVSMHQKAEHDMLHSAVCCVEVCDGTHDVFGVTVAEAGFIGGNTYIEVEKQYENDTIFTHKERLDNNHKHALVVNSGLVGVRCDIDVAVGDYVVPNIRGEAQKSKGNYGYLVTSLSEINGVQHAIISLSASSTLAKATADSVEDLSERMYATETRVTSVANVANSAYTLALDAKENAEVSSEYIEEKVAEVLGKMDEVDGIIGNLGNAVNNAVLNAAEAQAIAQGAVSSANAMKDEAVTKANEATANIKDLIEDLKPITEWSDPNNPENTGAQYLTEYMVDGLNTKVDVETFDSKTEEAFSAIERSAKSITSLMATIDKYCVGEYSQAYNLTLEQAISTLSKGMVYIPTVIHTESYGDYIQEFRLGYYYTWSGEYWIPSLSSAVTSLNSYPGSGSESVPYWVVTLADVVNDDITYDLGGLYKWEDNNWVKVASVADNTVSRAVSAIKQTADSIAFEVTNPKGSFAGLSARLTNTESDVQSLASWKTDPDGNEYNLATIKQTANDAGASIAQVIESVGKNGEVTAASIVTAINDGESSITLDADHINFEAKNYTIHADKINFEGSQFSSKMSETYSTKSETNTAKNDAITAANNNTNNKLKNYSTTEQTQTLINQKADSITLSVSTTYSTKDEMNTAKEAAITAANNSTDEKLKNYSSTTEMNSAINQKADSITLSVSETYSTKDEMDDLKKRVATAESSIAVNQNNIELKVAKDGVISSINQTSEEVKISAGKINLEGYVTITDLETEGSTTINGGNITTGKIDADLIDADELSAISANLGTVTAGSIQSENYDTFVAIWGDETNNLLPSEPGLYDINNKLVASLDKLEAKGINFEEDYTADNYQGNDSTSSKMNTYTNGVTLVLNINTSKIGSWAFTGCYYLKNIILPPNKEIAIHNKSFAMPGDSSKFVYFYGTPNDLDNILKFTIGGNSTPDKRVENVIGNGKFYYYSEEASSSDYWHYFNPGFKISAGVNENMIDSQYFKVSQDGITKTINGEFEGYIKAKEGDIGGLKIKSNGGLSGCQEEEEIYTLTEDGLTILKDTGKISVGSLSLTRSDNTSFIQTEGPLYIKGVKGEEIVTSIELMNDQEIEHPLEAEIKCYARTIDTTNATGTIKLWLTSDVDLMYSVTWNIYCKIGHYSGSTYVHNGTIATLLTIPAGKNKSDEKSVKRPTQTIASGGLLLPNFKFSTTNDFDSATNYTLKEYDNNTNHLNKDNVCVLNLGTTKQHDVKQSIIIQGSLVPKETETYSLGSNDIHWVTSNIDTGYFETLYADSGTIGSSDRNKKNTITDISDAYSQIFDDLRPVTYKYNDGTSDRLHTGFIAQEVRDATLNAGLTTKDFAAYCEWEEDNTATCGLRYSEFIALCVDQIQKLKKQVAELEEKLNTIQNDGAE